MTLLIVDDEELTRQGILGSVDFAGLGIDQILSARDGAEGIRIACEQPVDLLLSDIRMPKMDGLTMVGALQKTNPNLVTIFMSGYTDREYVKTALRLGAVNYIDKPIDIEELRNALRKAVSQVQANRLQQDSHKRSLEQISETLAFQLTVPYAQDADRVDRLWADYCSYCREDKEDNFLYVNSIVVQLEDVSSVIPQLPSIHQRLAQILAPHGLHVISSEKHLYYVVYHIYSGQRSQPRQIELAANFLREAFLPFSRSYVAVGEMERGISRAYLSFQSAVLLLQRAFSCPPGSILNQTDWSEIPEGSLSDLQNLGRLLTDALADGRKEDANQYRAELSDLSLKSRALLPSQIKSLYIDLFRELDHIREKQGIVPSPLNPAESVMDQVNACFCLDDLNRGLKDRIRAYFEDLSSQKAENQTIYLIRSYIGQHYSQSSLSVKDIADYANLSVSYLCTFFKGETGQTLNAYLTDFRMERAKQLLSDPRNRVSEISGMVGYNDGNYFSKSFRKSTGLSPTEFREKLWK